MSTNKYKLSPQKVWLGVTCTLWWNDDFLSIDAGIPFEQCISEMALAGFKGCSIGHKYPSDPKVLQSAMRLRDLRVSEPWVSTYFTIESMKQQTFDKIRQQLDFMDDFEAGWSDPRRADLVVAEFGHAVNPLPVALYPNSPVFDDAQWQVLAEGLNEIGAMAKSRGRKLCYHHHLGTGVMTAEAVDRLMAQTNPEMVHLLLDTAHMAAAGGDPLAVAQKHARRVKHVHFKNMRASVVKEMHSNGWSFQQGIEAGIFTVPGDPEGAITSYPEIIDILADAGFEGWLVVEAEQDPAKATPLKYAKMASAYLQKVLGWAQ
ncbi:MAG: myo-inosose-2 dehydratase [Nitrospira sp.]